MPIRNDDLTHTINNQVLYKELSLKPDQDGNDNISTYIVNIKKSGKGAPTQGRTWAEEEVIQQSPIRHEEQPGPSGFQIAGPSGKYNRITAEHIRMWQDISGTDRDLGKFAKQHNLFLDTLRHYINLKGTTLYGKALLQKASGREFSRMTAEHILIWQGIPEADRDLSKFAKQHNLFPDTLRRYINLKGITLYGKALLQKASGREFSRMTAEHIRMWQDIPEKDRDLAEFIGQYNLSPDKFFRYVNRKGATKLGDEYLKKESGHKFDIITAEHIQMWQDMPEETRDLFTFTEQHNLNSQYFRCYVNQKGVKKFGEVFLQKASVYQSDSATMKHVRMWQNMPEKKRNRIEFARKHNLDPYSLSRYINQKGTSRLGKIFLQQASGDQSNPVTAEHIQMWQDIPIQERNMVKFSKQHNLNPESLRRYVNIKGVTKLGEVFLQETSGHQFASMTVGHIQTWQDMSRQERDFSIFAKQHNLNPIILRHYINKKGVTEFGKAYLQKVSGYQFHSVTAEHIKMWKKMPKEERNSVKFSEQHNLSLSALRHYVGKKGTKGLGESLLKKATGHQFNPITEKHLQKWKDMLKQSRDLLKFADQHNLNPDTLSRLVNKRGFSKRGKVFLQKASGYEFNSLTSEHIQRWQEIPENQRNMAEFAEQHNLNLGTLTNYINKQGIKRRGQAFLEKASKRQRLDSSEDIMVLTDIKSEPGSQPVDLKMQHQVDNSYPILQDPKDPNVSILLDVEESIAELKVTRWYELNEMFDDMQASDIKTIKHKINQAVRSRLNQDENSLPNVRKEKLESLMYEKTDLADGHPRGVSVYALCDIQQFDVLGAYAGALYQNRESLQPEIRQFGERNVLAYGWETPKNKGFISGFNRGNILSRINTAMLPTGESIPNAKNNVAAIGVGKYLIVYIAKTEIKADEELLVNYGDTYQPVVIDPTDTKPAL